MKWSKAVEKIEKALEGGKSAVITYHRKWMKNDSHIDDVYRLNKYDWKGQERISIETLSDMIDEGSHIIDEVTVQ